MSLSKLPPDDFQNAWQEHSSQTRVSIDADILLRVMQRDQRSFRSAARLNDFGTIALSVLLIPVWVYLGVTNNAPWTWYLTLPVLCWWIIAPTVRRIKNKLMPIEAGEPLVQCVQRSLSEIDEQIRLTRGSFVWTTVPAMIAILAYIAHSAWIRSDDWWDLLRHVPNVVFLLSFFYFMYVATQHAASVGCEPRRQELVDLLRSLGEEPWNDENPNPKPNHSRRTFMIRYAIASAGLLLAIIIACITDPPFQDMSLISGDYAKRSPFAAVRWEADQPEVKLDDEWFKLISIDSVAAADIVAFSQNTYGNLWQKRFEEDLVEVMTRMGHAPDKTVTLTVRSMTLPENIIREDVPMTEDNRSAIRNAAQARDR